MMEAPPGEGYTSITNNLIEKPQTARGVKDYATLLGFEGKGKLLKVLPHDALVLDLGSGFGQFAKDLFLVRPDITTVSLNPALSSGTFRENQKRYWLKTNPGGIDVFKRLRTSKAQKVHDTFAFPAANPRLPIKDESFDAVFDCFSSIYYAPKEKLTAMVAEIIRVLKPGAFVAIGPLLWEGKVDELRKYLKSDKRATFKTRKIDISAVDWGVSMQITKK